MPPRPRADGGTLLDGTRRRARDPRRVAPSVAAFTARAGRPPGLGIVLVGDDPASEIYVRNKLKSGGEAGLRADLERLPATAHARRAAGGRRPAQSTATRTTASWCSRRCRPAMGADAERRVFDAIRPDKDVDGLHPLNVGRLVQNRASLVAVHAGRRHRAARALERLPIAGARAVVIGRSDIVGKPMALLLLHRHATVTICHSRTTRSAGDRRAKPTSSSPRSAAPAFVTARLRQAGRDGDRRRHHAGDRSRARRAAVSAGSNGATLREARARSSSATCIRMSPTSPAR